MASWGEAINKLTDRLETHAPERDPQCHYRLAPAVKGTRVDRHFLIRTPATLTIGTTSNGDPMVATVTMEIRYTQRTRETEMLRDMGADAEDVIQRVHYVPGAAWAAGDGYQFWVSDDATLEQDAEGGLLSIPVKFLYNMRT